MGVFSPHRHSLMPKLVRNIASVLVLIHMMGGCCLHHAHAEQTSHCDVAAAREDDCDHPSSDCLHVAECCEHSHHGERRECEEESCRFIPGRLRADNEVTVIPARVVFVRDDVSPLLSAGYSRAGDIIFRGAPPVPLHVLKQSFLL